MFMRVYLSGLFLITAFKLSAATIFVADSYHAEYIWTSECRHGLETGLDGQHQLIYAEMDTKRIPASAFIKQANAVWRKILLTQPDLVVTMDDNALKLLGQRVSDAGFPLIFMGVNRDPREYFKGSVIPENVSGVLERPLIKQNTSLLPRLLNIRANRILLMMDSSVTSEAILHTTLGHVGPSTEDGIYLDVFRAANYKEWQVKVNSLSGDNYDALLVTNYARLNDEHGKYVPLETTTRWTSINSKIPVFALWRHSVGKHKAIGGFVNSGYRQGEIAAEIVKETVKTGKVPYVEVSAAGEYLFSQSELERWGVTLPDSVRARAEIVE